MVNVGEDHGAGDELPQVETRHVASAIVVVVRGELDELTAPRVQPAIERSLDTLDGLSLLVIDLTELLFLGSTGLKILIDVCDLAAESGLGFHVVVGDNRHATRPLEITGLDTVLPLRRHLAEALGEQHQSPDVGRATHDAE